MNIVFINRMMGIKFGGGENADVNFANYLEQLGNSVEFIIGREFSRLSIPLNGFSKVKYIRTPYLRNYHYKYCNSKYKIIRFLIGCCIGLWLDSFLFQMAAFCYLIKNKVKADIFQICGLPQLAHLIEKAGLGKCAVRWPGPIGEKIGKIITKYSMNWGPGKAYESIAKYDNRAVNISNGVDTERFKIRKKNTNYLSKYNISENDTIFLYVGRIVPIKNVMFLAQTFLAAFSKNRNIKLIIVGDGEEKNSLNLFIERNCLKDNVITTGAKYGDELLEHYNMADVFCITSVYENFSNAVLEAMSFSLPVIATKVGFLPNMIESGINGLLVEPDNHEELCYAVLKLAIDEELRQKMGETNREKVVDNFSWESSARLLIEAYEKIDG